MEVSLGEVGGIKTSTASSDRRWNCLVETVVTPATFLRMTCRKFGVSPSATLKLPRACKFMVPAMDRNTSAARRALALVALLAAATWLDPGNPWGGWAPMPWGVMSKAGPPRARRPRVGPPSAHVASPGLARARPRGPQWTVCRPRQPELLASTCCSKGANLGAAPPMVGPRGPRPGLRGLQDPRGRRRRRPVRQRREAHRLRLPRRPRYPGRRHDSSRVGGFESAKGSGFENRQSPFQSIRFYRSRRAVAYCCAALDNIFRPQPRSDWRVNSPLPLYSCSAALVGDHGLVHHFGRV